MRYVPAMAQIASLHVAKDLFNCVIEDWFFTIACAAGHRRHFLILSAVVATFQGHIKHGLLLLLTLLFYRIRSAVQIDDQRLWELFWWPDFESESLSRINIIVRNYSVGRDWSLCSCNETLLGLRKKRYNLLF